MTAHDVHDHVRAALSDAAKSVEVPELLPLAAIAPLAGRRSRRRQMAGGLATMLLVAVVTVGVGFGLKDDSPNAVFAGQIDQPIVPSVVMADGDRFVGLAVLGPFELDEFDNVHVVLVTSEDGVQWERVEDAPVIVSSGALLDKSGDEYHLVGTRGIQVVDLDGVTSVQRDLVHVTSRDLVTWTETIHSLSVDTIAFQTAPTGLGFVDAGPIVLLSHTATHREVDAEIEALGYDMADMCEFVGVSNRTRIRMCGETDSIDLSPPQQTRSPNFDLVALHDDRLMYLDLPEVDDGRARSPYQTALYQTPDGIGITGRDVFESTDGLNWELVDVGREPAVMMAARGSERVYRTAVHVQRYGDGDPLKGSGFSADGGVTWLDVPIGDLFADGEGNQPFFSDLRATPHGWFMVARRTLTDRPEVPGVELQQDESSTFMVIVDGYVLEGQAPFGAAELRNPAGQIVRSWDHLEVANPLWSGLEFLNGDIVIREETGSKSIVVTAEQWSSLMEPLGPTTSELLFSPDGQQWSILDTSSAWTRVLAVSSDGVLVQRWLRGNFSHTVPAVELVPFPVADAD